MHFARNQNAFVIFLAFICQFSITSSQDSSSNKNKNNNQNNENNGNKNNVKNASNQYAVNSTFLPHARLDDLKMYSKEYYDYQERGRLVVEFKDVTTTSIHVNWSLPEMKFNDSILKSDVVCETSNGLLISKKHVTSQAASYRLENLHASTSYFVCVYMLENSLSSNTRVLHYGCKLLETKAHIHIPTLRTDSIVAVVLTLGYIIAMIIIGYVTWRWKRKMKEQDEAKQRLAIEDEDYDEEEGMLNGGLHDNNQARNAGAGGSSHVNFRGIGSGSYGYSASVDDIGSRKEKDSMRNSKPSLDSTDRARGASKGNNVGSVGCTESDVVLERNSNSVEEINGCLDFKRNSRGSNVKLADLSENGNTQEKKQQKSQSVDDSPVKVTEISF